MRNKRHIRCLLVALAVLHLVVVFAGFVAPYDAKEQDRSLPYARPTRLHFIGASGFHIRPFVYASIADADGYREDRTREYPVHFFVKESSYSLIGMIKSDVHLFGVDAPARIMLLGSDAFGRDEFSRLLIGGQISLAAGLLATLITLTTAAMIGTVSGFYGGWVDEALMGVSE